MCKWFTDYQLKVSWFSMRCCHDLGQAYTLISVTSVRCGDLVTEVHKKHIHKKISCKCSLILLPS